MENVEPDVLYTTGQAAVVLGVTRQTIVNWCNQSVLPSIRAHDGASRRIKGTDLLALLSHSDQTVQEEVSL